MKPTYWIWTGIDEDIPTNDLYARYRSIRARGITGVFLGGLDERTIAAAWQAGLDVDIWMWTTNRRDQWIRDNHPEWYMVSRSGKSCFDQPPYVEYYRWVNPVIPEVRAYIQEKVEEIAVHPAVSGVHLDYVRYPDVQLPRDLWEQYGLDQTEELADYDFDYSPATADAFRAATGRDLHAVLDPAHDQDWLHFRYDAISSLVKQLADATHRHGKRISAAVFPTPRMARRICRQDWGGWPLDFACPMVYHSFYRQPVEWIGECVLENIQSARFPIVAGLYMPAFNTPEEFEDAIHLAFKRGAKGISFFGDLTEEYWAAFERTL